MKLDFMEAEHDRISDELQELNNSMNFLLHDFDGSDKERARLLEQVEKKISTVESCLVHVERFPKMGELYRQDDQELEDMLLILLNDLRLFFAVDNMISTEGLKGLVPIIVHEYKGLSLEDVALCFMQAKKGYYGEVYNRLDGQVILGWLRKYDQEKRSRHLERMYSTHIQHKAGNNDGRSQNEDTQEAFRKAKAQVLLDRAKK
jgi:hypothetical protein